MINELRFRYPASSESRASDGLHADEARQASRRGHGRVRPGTREPVSP